MLVLSRKAGQELVIDDRVRIVVQRIQGNRVTIGIEAPDDVHVMRGELQKLRAEFQGESTNADVAVGSAVVTVDLPIDLTTAAYI